MATSATLTIEEVTERLIDYRGKTPPKTDSGVRLITAKVIKNGTILPEPAEYIAADFYDEWMRRGLPEDLDVLITTEAPLGEVAILRLRERVALAQRVILLRANRSVVDPIYLFYALQSDLARAELNARATGTTVSGIKQSELRQVRVPVWPLSVQRHIATTLAAYDDLIENCHRRIRLLDEMARALYREWFVNFRYPGHEKVPLVYSPVGEIPGGWRLGNVGTLTTETRRGVPKGDVAEQMPYVGLEHIPRRSLALNDWIELQGLGSNKLAFQKGEVLFGKIRPNFHKVSVAPFSGICSADTIVMSARQDTYYGYVVCMVSSDWFVARSSATANGSKMPRANWDVLAELPIAIPPPNLADTFDTVVRSMIAEQHSLVFAGRNLRKTRDLLLPRLLSGQLSVSDLAA
jgi:type I restriction enzyme S subunit